MRYILEAVVYDLRWTTICQATIGSSFGLPYHPPAEQDLISLRSVRNFIRLNTYRMLLL